MLSLKRSINELEAIRTRYRVAVETYLGAIDSIDRHAIPIERRLLDSFREQLRRIRQAISEEPEEEKLRGAQQLLDRELHAYREQTAGKFERKEHEIKEIALILAQAAESLHRRNDVSRASLSGFSQQIEQTLQLDDLSKLKECVVSHLTSFQQTVEATIHDSQAQVAKLQQQVERFQASLDQARGAANRDPLTGLGNRREADEEIARRIGVRSRFCIMLFDLDDFKLFNDEFGHLAGDEVLRLFSHLLVAQFRAGDSICRWGGDEFLVILDCDLVEAAGVHQRLLKALSAGQTITVNGKTEAVRLKTSVGIAQYVPGESVEQLFARADKVLYDTKRKTRSPA